MELSCGVKWSLIKSSGVESWSQFVESSLGVKVQFNSILFV